MDGENAWEYFDNNAKDFLITLYQGLCREKNLRSRTLSEFAKEGPFKKIDARLWPGSWINADFGVWAGSRENNSNWQLLARIKKTIDKHKQPAKQLEKAVHYLRIIEGSDWNWWNTFEENSGDFGKIMLSYVKELSKLLKTDFLKHT